MIENAKCRMQNAKLRCRRIKNMIVGDDLRVVPLTPDDERTQGADTQVGPYKM